MFFNPIRLINQMLVRLTRFGRATEPLEKETTMTMIRKIFRDNKGATAIEYG